MVQSFIQSQQPLLLSPRFWITCLFHATSSAWPRFAWRLLVLSLLPRHTQTCFFARLALPSHTQGEKAPWCLLFVVHCSEYERWQNGENLIILLLNHRTLPILYRLWFECLWITSESVFTLPAHVLSMELNKITIMSNCISKCLFLNRTQMASLECDTNIALSGWVVEVCGCVPVCARVC